MKPTFKEGKDDPLMSDTDSFLIKIDGYKEVNSILKKHAHRFDFSNLGSHELRSDQNRLKSGFVKFELGAEICVEFCGLSPKCYSLRTDAGFKQTVKGIRKRFAHELYKQCLLEGTSHEAKVRDITHYKQTLYQVSVIRRCLNPVDFKRFYLNATESLSFEHSEIIRPFNV